MPKSIKSDPGAPKSSSMMKNCTILGENIREERRNRNFTMEEMVAMVPISESYLGLLERGQRTPSLECLFEFCSTFGITPNDLLLPREKGADGKKKLVISDPNSVGKSDNFEAALSILRHLNDEELDYIVDVMISLQKMTKSRKKGKA